MTIREMFGVHSTVQPTNHFIAGMECEIEDLASVHEDLQNNNNWQITQDGSLRNNGHEFISKPLGKEELLKQFDILQNSIKYQCDDVTVRFSPRTSTHVHVNCLDLDEKQVHSIVMWYALFEPIFFLLVAPARSYNIHCVGLDQTILSEFYKRKLPDLFRRWSKYTALNLLPLSKYGTIEFRHMEGTDDMEKMTMWLNTLENLWAYGQKSVIHKNNIMSPAIIKEAFQFIFKDSPEALKYENLLPSLLADSVIDIKLSLL